MCPVATCHGTDKMSVLINERDSRSVEFQFAKEYDTLLERLEQLEAEHPESYDPNSPIWGAGVYSGFPQSVLEIMRSALARLQAMGML